jgi:hypothetical protein
MVFGNETKAYFGVGGPKLDQFHVSKIFPGKFSNKMSAFIDMGATV